MSQGSSGMTNSGQVRSARFTEQEIISILQQVDNSPSIAGLARQHGISVSTLNRWRRHYGIPARPWDQPDIDVESPVAPVSPQSAVAIMENDKADECFRARADEAMRHTVQSPSATHVSGFWVASILLLACLLGLVGGVGIPKVIAGKHHEPQNVSEFEAAVAVLPTPGGVAEPRRTVPDWMVGEFTSDEVEIGETDEGSTTYTWNAVRITGHGSVVLDHVTRDEWVQEDSGQPDVIRYTNRYEGTVSPTGVISVTLRLRMQHDMAPGVDSTRQTNVASGATICGKVSKRNGLPVIVITSEDGRKIILRHSQVSLL